MIALLLSLALGQEEESDWTDCQNHSSIAGTAGFENARSANETNALAYGAARFVQEEVSGMLESAKERSADGKWVGAFANDIHFAFGAARVPTLEVSGGCPSALRISNRPLDLGGVRIGFAGSNGTLGFFYSGSVSYGITPTEDGRLRFLYHMSGYTYGSFAAIAAPVLGRSLRLGEGASLVQTDFVVGASYTPGPLAVKVGWVGSRGVFADVEGEVPVFAAAVLDQLGIGGNLVEGGLRKLKTGAGLTSVFAKNQPFRSLQPIGDNNELQDVDDLPSVDFTTGHIEQYDINGVFDLRASYALRPTPALHEGTLGYHSRNFWSDPSSEKASFLIRGGVVQLPDLWFYGVGGGIRPTVHGEMQMVVPGDGAELKISAVVDYNSPEKLVLFPYAVNAVFVGYNLRGSF